MTTNDEVTRRRRAGRRPPDEVRSLILQAAHHLFSTNGYHGTATRQIADAAGVSESVLYRHFATKAELFKTTVLQPFTEFVDSWTKEWDARLTSDLDILEIGRAFAKGFHDVAYEHQELMRTLIAARVKGGEPALAEVAATVSAQIADSLAGIQRNLQEHGAARHLRAMDEPVAVAFAVGSILSMVLLDDWLFSSGARRPGKKRQIEEAARMLIYGVTKEPD
ncbi:TetR/AcrR family transcriptional regulator [Mycobacterium sp.]|uniref:TetR/AcrR family transcriptional regulator n=1 Tax=Mycobacterium sp. TaxID=1785 RepID=UPI0025E9F970|nr:TetR/AcrR family transcriptional regulator [Mycobacterium sp.]